MRAGKSWIDPKNQSAGYRVPSRDESPGPARSAVDRSHAVSLVVPRRDVRRCRQPLRQPRRSAGDVVRSHTHVLFGRGNSYAGKVCRVIHENKYSEWKCSMLRENRLLSLTAGFRLGFPAAQYKLMESVRKAARDPLGFPGKPQGHPGARASPRIAPTSAGAWGRAAPPLVLRSPRCELGSLPAPTS